MELNFDSERIDIECPGCGKKFDETLGRMKREKHIVCPGCQADINVDTTQFEEALRSVQEALDDFGRSLRKFGKS